MFVLFLFLFFSEINSNNLEEQKRFKYLLQRANTSCHYLAKYGLEPPPSFNPYPELFIDVCGKQLILDYLAKRPTRTFLNKFYMFCYNLHDYEDQNIHLDFCNQVVKLYKAKNEKNAVCSFQRGNGTRIKRSNEFGYYSTYDSFDCTCKPTTRSLDAAQAIAHDKDENSICELAPILIIPDEDHPTPSTENGLTCHRSVPSNDAPDEIRIENLRKRNNSDTIEGQVKKCRRNDENPSVED